MRVLLLLRGSAGCGKTTWIENHGLKPYTLSADDIRMLCASPSLTVTGSTEINQTNDNTVWNMLFKLLELRMQNGEFTVIDATNSKTSEMNRYKELCNTYKYRIFCVDFTGVPIEVTKEQNRNRPLLKQVPESAIDKMYARFATQKIPSGITVIQPNELDKIWLKKIDLSNYSKIHHIGDIHGCNTALQEYLALNGGIKDDEFYIFCGDYVDRGLENAEVLDFLLSIYERDNILFLEGNHEKWLWVWANNGISYSKEFELITKTQLENYKIDKKEVRKFYRKLGQCAYYQYKGNTYLVTHGGLSTIPDNLTTVTTRQMIQGVGNYNDFEAIADSFYKNTEDNCYQIHGHRNTKQLPVKVNDKVFNLEGQVEFGGHLRCIQILNDGTHDTFEVKNNVFRERDIENINNAENKELSIAKTIMALRQNKYIQEKKFGNISSFNFTKSAFYNKIWDDQTTKARGLFINIPKEKVVARSYNKFFNINEREDTKLDILQYRFSFPVTAYVKENGFLGIISYNEEDDSLFITSKSDPTSQYSGWLKNIINEKIDTALIEEIKEYIKENNVSFVFECIDTKNDPHIIDYEENQLFLLDIIYNDINYHKFGYEKLCDIAKRFNLIAKEKAYVIESWQEFYDWYYEVTNEDYKYNNKNIEGFVLEDSKGYMTKLKLHYYNFWKFMRSISHEAIRKGYIERKKTSALTSALANQYYGWVKTLYNEENKELIPRDICSLRRLFFKTETGKIYKD